MLNKKITVILLLIILLCAVFTESVFASDESLLDDVHGFGSYYVEEDDDGEIVVYIDTGNGTEWDRNYWRGRLDSLMAQYGRTITWVTGVATITLVIVFIWLCVKSAFVASEHWIIKRQTMIALLWVGIGTALMGSATLILLIFQNAFV